MRSPQRLRIATAVLHLGAVRFAVTGPLRYTMTAREAVELSRLIPLRTLIPIHHEGWKHFSEGRDAIEQEFAWAPEGFRERVHWLPLGAGVELHQPV